MSIGYACLAVGVPRTNLKSCLGKNATEENLLALISHNLQALENIIDYNTLMGIRLIRISSDLIPFGSSPLNQLPWWEVYAAQFSALGKKARAAGMRLSMHPGQYTVLNSPEAAVVARAIADLQYHGRVLDSLGLSCEHKIILHIGGAYRDKQEASKRFIAHYQHLPATVQRRLVLENDDRTYNISDVLEIGAKLNTPVVFDNLHHQINGCAPEKTAPYWISECAKSWQAQDGKQKVHYSQQAPGKRRGSHSSSIRINEFIAYYNRLPITDLDIMLETKDKNLSAIKCLHCTLPHQGREALMREWQRYKYAVLEKSPESFAKIEHSLSNEPAYTALSFYNDLEHALSHGLIPDNSLNAATYIWTHSLGSASATETNRWLTVREKYQQGLISLRTLKNFCWRMAVKYRCLSLMESYYFLPL